MCSDVVVGSVLIIWSRLHLIDVSLLIFYIGDCPLIKVGFLRPSVITVEPVSRVVLIFASCACLAQCWVHMCSQLLYSVADLSFYHCTIAFFVFLSPVCEVT